MKTKNANKRPAINRVSRASKFVVWAPSLAGFELQICANVDGRDEGFCLEDLLNITFTLECQNLPFTKLRFLFLRFVFPVHVTHPDCYHASSLMQFSKQSVLYKDVTLNSNALISERAKELASWLKQKKI